MYASPIVSTLYASNLLIVASNAVHSAFNIFITSTGADDDESVVNPTISVIKD